MVGQADAVDFERLALDGLAYAERYKLMFGSVVPRPIAFVTTLGDSGVVNLAPFSSFMVASVEEGLLAFSVGPSECEEKDTLTNARRTEEFVINTVPEDLAQQVQLCAEAFPADVSEAEAAGLHLIPSERIRVPRVAESRVHFECRLHTIIRFGQSHLVVGRVVLMHARKGLVRDFKIDIHAYAPLGRLAGRSYSRVTDIFSV